MGARTLITTLVTAAAAPSGGSVYDLTTLGVIKDELNITNSATDSLLRGYISRASAAAQSYCNRIFASETIKDEFWAQRDCFPVLLQGKFEPLQLSRYPLISVTTALENSTALVANTDFRSDLNKGQLIRLTSGTAADGSTTYYPTSWPAYPISITYVAGYATIPGDVVDAVIRMVKNRWFMRGRDSTLRQQNIPGVLEQTFWVATGTESGALTPDIIDLLDNYRVPVIS